MNKAKLNNFITGQVVRFDGKSADSQFTGFANVKIINPHSNAGNVVYTDGKGRRLLQYEASGAHHVPTATVERPARKDRPAKQFEAYYFTLTALDKGDAK